MEISFIKKSNVEYACALIKNYLQSCLFLYDIEFPRINLKK